MHVSGSDSYTLMSCYCYLETNIGSDRTASSKQEERRFKSHLQGTGKWQGELTFYLLQGYIIV